MNKISRLILSWIKFIVSYAKKKDPNIWVFGEWFGKKCGDNCAYFANYIVESNKPQKVFWICEKNVDTSILNSDICIIEKNSISAEKILQKAGAIFLNQGFPDVSRYPYNRYGRSLSINFWHGFPWKKIGHDGYKKNNFIFRFYCRLLDPIQNAKYFISLSDNYSNKIHTAFGVKSKAFIKAGYPRNAPFFSEEWKGTSKENVVKLLKQTCSHIEKQKVKIIAYMPTFRDKGNELIDLSCAFDESFKRWLFENDIFVIQKVHFVDAVVRKKETEQRECCNVISINDISANVLMSASDVLISDYSSCVFDFLILDRPVIHFVYDYDQYKNKDRGLYFDIDEIRCGLSVYSVLELQNAIKRSLENPREYADLRTKRLKKLMKYESADSCEKIYSWICNKLHIEHQTK